MLVGSSRCANFSPHPTPLKLLDSKGACAKRNPTHDMCFRLAQRQIDDGDFFLHEHAANAKSWILRMTRDLLKRPDIVRTVGDHCPFGLWWSDTDGSALVKRPTGWMTSSMRSVAALDRKCSGNHRHCYVTSCADLSEQAALKRYRLRLVNSILRALRQETLDRRAINRWGLDNTSTNLSCG